MINGYVELDISKLYDPTKELPDLAKDGEFDKLKNLDYLKEVLKAEKPIIAKDYLVAEGYLVIKVNGGMDSRTVGRLDILLINGDDVLENIHIEFDSESYTGISARGVTLTAIA